MTVFFCDAGQFNCHVLWPAKDLLVSDEYTRVMNTLGSAEHYDDMANYALTCKNWLATLVSMAPEKSADLWSSGLWTDEELKQCGELSPTSRQLKTEATCWLRLPTTALMNDHKFWLPLYHYHNIW